MADKQPPLTNQELREIRAQLLASRSISWVGKRIRILLTWLVTIVGGFIFLGDHIGSWFKSIVGGS